LKLSLLTRTIVDLGIADSCQWVIEAAAASTARSQVLTVSL
jgi:hypothetical protein